VATGTPEHTFLETLARGRPDPAVALPPAVRPLARALAGPRAVEVVAGATTRRALAAVGKRAATTGSTIHLERRPSASLRSDELEVLAHELGHVARPSPIPRFFAGRPDEEELEAQRLGRQARGRSDLAAIADGVRPPEGGTRGLPVGGIGAVAGLVNRAEASTAAAESVIRRTMAAAPSSTTSPTTSPTASTASTASTAAHSDGTIRRTVSGPVSGPGSGTAAAAAAGSSSVIRRAETTAASPGRTRTPTSTDERERLDRLVVDLERRLRREAERRRWRYGEMF
jgi:hypothetical protein